MKPKVLFRALVIVALGVLSARAEVRLHNLFTDHMVLQQGTTVPVWGWADAGEKASATTKNGKWMVKLKNLKPGAPDTLRVRGEKEGKTSLVQVSDVVVG